MESLTNDRIQTWIERLRSGDDRACEEALALMTDRLRRLTSKMLKSFPGVRRWEDTDDVFQNASLRLHQSIKSAQLSTVDDFIRFASLLIRRELIDLSRHYQGPHGHGANHGNYIAPHDSLTSDRVNPGTDTHDPQQLAAWTDFHRNVDRLPDEDRQVFDLLWYQELTQLEAAEILGVSERTIQRRWQQARLRLHALLEGELPDHG
jgi:RNA polymerase sigma factor (sigma-70 family)